MKKIFTLAFTLALLGSVFAQYDPKDDWNNQNRDGGYKKEGRHKDDNRNYNTYYFTPRERDLQIEQIKREYDYRIRSVQARFFMGRYQKMRQINFLQEQRQREIDMVLDKFNDRRNLFNDHRRKYKKDWY